MSDCQMNDLIGSTVKGIKYDRFHIEIEFDNGQVLKCIAVHLGTLKTDLDWKEIQGGSNELL